MAESKDLQVAQSLLDDAERAIDQIGAEEFGEFREIKAREIRRGDLARAVSHIEKAATKGADARSVADARSRAHFLEGMMYMEVVEAPYINLGPFDPHRLYQFVPLLGTGLVRRYWTRKFGALAVAAFQRSADAFPNQVTYFNMGLMLLAMDDRAAAESALHSAQEGDDEAVSIQAAKALSRS